MFSFAPSVVASAAAPKLKLEERFFALICNEHLYAAREDVDGYLTKPNQNIAA